MPSGGKKYAYYVCSTKKSGKGCTMHSTSEIELTDIVFSLISNHIAHVLDVEELLKYVATLSHTEKEAKKLYAGLAIREEEIKKYENLKLSVHEDFKDGILDKNEFVEFNLLYTEKLNDARQASMRLKNDIDIIVSGAGENQKWIDEFKAYRNITELSRNVVVSLIKKIAIHEDGSVDITFMYDDKFYATVQILEQLQRPTQHTPVAQTSRTAKKKPSSANIAAVAERLVV